MIQDLWRKAELLLVPRGPGLFCSFRPLEESPRVPAVALQGLTVDPSAGAPEQVLLLLQSQLSSETPVLLLLLLQGLQEPGLQPLPAWLLITPCWLAVCLLLHHSESSKCFDPKWTVLAHVSTEPGLPLLSAPVLGRDADLCVLLSSPLSLLLHVHRSTLHPSQSASSVLIGLLALLHLLGLGLNLAVWSHSSVLLALNPRGHPPLIQSHCSASAFGLPSLPPREGPLVFRRLSVSSQTSRCLKLLRLQ